MELIKRQLPESEIMKTAFVKHKGIYYAVSYNPRTGDSMYDTREEAERQIKIRGSYVERKAVVIYDKGYDCYLMGFDL